MIVHVVGETEKFVYFLRVNRFLDKRRWLSCTDEEKSFVVRPDNEQERLQVRGRGHSVPPSELNDISNFQSFFLD